MEGTLIDHIQKYAESYLSDRDYQAMLMKQGPEVQEQENAKFRDIVREVGSISGTP